MNDTLFNDIQTLRHRISDLMARGTSPEILADTQHDWIQIRDDVDELCSRITSTDPSTAHAVLDEFREMIQDLEVF